MDPRTQNMSGSGTDKEFVDPNTKASGFVNQQDTPENIGDRFKINSKGDPTGDLHQLSLGATDFAKQIIELAPPGRERQLALTNLEQCFLWLNAGVSRYGVNV